MDLIKALFKKFKCSSECDFNIKDVPDDLFRIDLSQYMLKDKDVKRLLKIQKNRPSKHNYTHRPIRHNYSPSITNL
jgi:hypothetical protein